MLRLAEPGVSTPAFVLWYSLPSEVVCLAKASTSSDQCGRVRMTPSAAFAPMVPIRDTAPEPLGQRLPRHQPVAGTASRSTSRARAFTCRDCRDAAVAPLSHDGSSSADAANARTRRSLAVSSRIAISFFLAAWLKPPSPSSGRSKNAAHSTPIAAIDSSSETVVVSDMTAP